MVRTRSSTGTGVQAPVQAGAEEGAPIHHVTTLRNWDVQILRLRANGVVACPHRQRHLPGAMSRGQ
eukprot:2725143-Alexandrium_andersonii.AAC.1